MRRLIARAHAALSVCMTVLYHSRSLPGTAKPRSRGEWERGFWRGEVPGAAYPATAVAGAGVRTMCCVTIRSSASKLSSPGPYACLLNALP